MNDGTETWTRDFYDYETAHSVPLLGFKPGTTNEITVTVSDPSGSAATISAPLVFVASPLPATFPTINVLKCEPMKMEPGYTLFIVQNRTNSKFYILIVDNSGQVVWYGPTPTSYNNDVRQLENGDLFIVDKANRFDELNLLGDMVKTWYPPAGYPIDIHDGVPTDRGTILYLSNVSREVTNFPTSATDPNAPRETVNVNDNPVVEISATNGALLNVWSPLDMLDPTRVTYLTFGRPSSYGVDNEHANAVLEDPTDNSIIVSLRNQNAVFKFSRTTGKLKWILGSHANWGPEWQKYLLTPVGMPFEWNYGQHAPAVTPQGTLLVYDDGNERADPFDPPIADQDNYSRGVEYKIDENKMEVSQLWDSRQAGGDRLFTPIIGDCDWLPKTGNILVTYGFVDYLNGAPPSPYSPNAVMVRIKEITHDPVPKVVFDLSLFDYGNTSTNYKGYFVYRSDRIPDLYPVAKATRAVADLITAAGNLGSRDHRLIAGLGAAVASIGEHKLHTAVNQLRAFQHRIHAAKLDRVTTSQLMLQSQSVIDALNTGQISYPSELLTSEWSYFEPPHALADLIESVGNARVQAGRALIGNLAEALTSLGENDTNAAVRKLFGFQKLVRVTWMDPNLAKQFTFQSQRILEALGGGQGGLNCHLKAHVKNGKPWLEFSGNQTATYSVEASTDLVHWTKIGKATPTGNGNFEFEDTHAGQFPVRYYRIASP